MSIFKYFYLKPYESHGDRLLISAIDENQLIKASIPEALQTPIRSPSGIKKTTFTILFS